MLQDTLRSDHDGLDALPAATPPDRSARREVQDTTQPGKDWTGRATIFTSDGEVPAAADEWHRCRRACMRRRLAQGRGDSRGGGVQPPSTVGREVYLSLVDAVSQDAELLQAHLMDQRLALPPEWVEQAVISIVSGAAASLIANATYSGQGVIDRLLARRKDKATSIREQRLLTIEVISTLREADRRDAGAAVSAAVREVLVERGVDEELVTVITENVRSALLEPRND